MLYYSNTTTDANTLNLNTLAFDIPEKIQIFYFSRTQLKDKHLTKLSVPQRPCNIMDIFPDLKPNEELYTSFDFSQEGLTSLSVDFTHRDNFQLYKKYLVDFFFRYFRKHNILADETFIGDIQVWVKAPDKPAFCIKDCVYYDRFTLRPMLSDIDGKHYLIVSYDRPAKILKYSVAKLKEEYNVSKSDPFQDSTTDPVTLLNKVLVSEPYEGKDGKTKKYRRFKICKYEKIKGRENLSNVYPIVNNQLALYLGHEDDTDSVETWTMENRYKKYIKRISLFVREYLMNDEILSKMAHNGQFTRIQPSCVNSQSKSLMFGQGIVATSPRKGTNNGPYKRPEDRTINILFIAPSDFKKQAIDLWELLKGGYGPYYKGLSSYVGLGLALKRGILFDPASPIESIRQQLLERIPELNGAKTIAIYFTPISKNDKDMSQHQIYYHVKEMLLGYHIASQFIETDKMVTALESDKKSNPPKYNFAYTLQNISVAITAKLGGTPWKINVQEKRELVIGVGAFHNSADNTKYIGSAFSFDNTGSFNSFEYFRKDQLKELISSIIYAIVEFKKIFHDPERLVIHYYKAMREKEVEAIEKALENINLDIPIYILTINKTESEDIIAFDSNSDEKMPVSGSFVNLGNCTYLLCNNTRYTSATRPESYPFPIKMKIKCPNYPETLDMPMIKGLIDQVYQFSRIYWKSVAQQNLPVTIKYPEMIAEMVPFFEDKSLPQSDVLWFL